MMTEVQFPPDSLYRKVVHPGLDIINHANKLGLRLKSRSALRTPVTPLLSRDGERDIHSGLPARAKSSPQRLQSHYQTQYIHNIVVPLPTASNELQQTLYRSLTASPHSSRSSRFRQNSLPLVSRGTRASTAKTIMTVKSMGNSLQSEKYLSSTPHTDRLLLDETGEIARRNTSSQALRFEAEKRNLDRSRTMKRLSEIQTHRVDRMYYLSANSAPIHARYHVDPDDLSRLKELSRVRHTTPHYGRGLSSRSDNEATDSSQHDQQTPRPTPVSSTPQPNFSQAVDEDGHHDNQQTFITQRDSPRNEAENEHEQRPRSEVDSLATLPGDKDAGGGNNEKSSAEAEETQEKDEGTQETHKNDEQNVMNNSHRHSEEANQQVEANLETEKGLSKSENDLTQLQDGIKEQNQAVTAQDEGISLPPDEDESKKDDK